MKKICNACVPRGTVAACFFLFSVSFNFCSYNKKEHYTVAWRYEYYFLVIKTIFYERAQRVRKILFLPLENNIHFFAPPCNILYVFTRFVFPLKEITRAPWNTIFIHSFCISAANIARAPTDTENYLFAFSQWESEKLVQWITMNNKLTNYTISHNSCCVVVKNIERTLFFLPRPKVMCHGPGQRFFLFRTNFSNHYRPPKKVLW